MPPSLDSRGVRLRGTAAAAGRTDGGGGRRCPLPRAVGGPRVPDRGRAAGPELRRGLVCERLGRGGVPQPGHRPGLRVPAHVRGLRPSGRARGRARRRQRDGRRLCGVRASRARPRFDRHCRSRRSRLGRDGAESRPDPRIRPPSHRLYARERASQGEDAGGAGGDGTRNPDRRADNGGRGAARRSGRDDGATGRSGRTRTAGGGVAHAFLHDAHLHGPRRR